MGALEQEVNLLLEDMKNLKIDNKGGRSYYHGDLYGIETVLVYSRVGKVAASSTATSLIERYGIDKLVFVGVAGAMQSHCQIGDIIIGTELYQHDMDATPVFQRHEIPFTDMIFFKSEQRLIDLANQAARGFISQITQFIQKEKLAFFNIEKPQIILGKIASGDSFVTHSKRKAILDNMPDVTAVEMEGAAVAQVCYDHGIPSLVVRVVSDQANDNSPIDFQRFISSVANIYSREIIKNLYFHIKESTYSKESFKMYESGLTKNDAMRGEND